MSSTGFPSNQIYAGNTVSAALTAPVPSAPLLAELDRLEKTLMQLRESVSVLQGRLVPSVAKIRPQTDGQGCSTAQIPNASAITNRLCHLQSIAAEVQQTINVLHEDLEL